MKAISLLVNSYLPPELRNYSETYDVKSMNRIMRAVAEKYPERFAEITKKISDLGRTASYVQGETITLKDLEPVIDKKGILDEMAAEIKALPKDSSFTQRRREIYQKYTDRIEKETANNALKNRNNIALAVMSGARGKMPQLRAMISPVGTFSDYKGEVIDVYSKESFADGIRPATFLASTYGSRASVISSKCLSKSTLVRMGDLSVKEIKDIQVGDTVLGADKTGHIFPVRVLNVFDQGEKECYEYKFKFSSTKYEEASVTCTEDHKMLMVSEREYKRKKSAHDRGMGPKPTWKDMWGIEELPCGRMSRGVRCSPYNPIYPQGGYEGKKHEPWARLLGLLIGDGCLTMQSTVLSCADPSLIEDIQGDLEKVGQEIKKLSGENYSWSIATKGYTPLDNNSIQKGVKGFVRGSLCERKQLLKDYDLLGHYAWEKRLPKGWQEWDKESVASCIAGLLSADGSFFVSKQKSKSSTTDHITERYQVSISLGVTSKELIEDVQLALLMYFGITSRKELPVMKGGFGSVEEGRVRPLYSLEISRAEDVLKLHEEIGKYLVGVKRGKFDELVKKVVIIQHNLYGKFMYQEKRNVGKVHCFDIEVDHPDHLFVLANGMITSNSSTAKGGDLAKQFASIAGDMVIRRNDCGTGNGIALAPDDPSLRGRVLAQNVDNFKAGTVITREMAATLGKAGHKFIMVRSPLTCACPDGLCSKCVGQLYHGGKMPRVGDSVGLIASTTSMEPVTQMALCLSPDTKVMTRKGKKSIKDIYRGDEVLAFNFPGSTSFVPVVDKYKNASVYLRKYTLEKEGKKIKVVCSDRHKFLSVNGDKVPISLCYIRDLPIGVKLDKGVEWYHVVKRSEEFFSEAYDIEIATAEHLFLLANGVITSNSAKHTAGMTQGKKSYSGLVVIQQFTQSPEKFKDVGVVSEVDGKVDSVEEAPQGGTYVTVSGERHYIPAGHEVQVQQGQTVEAGDQLAEGLVDAEDVVRLKGLGAGRKYYAERLNKILEDSGAKTDKRNTEILARAAIRHVRINSNEGLGNYLPDDVVDYSALEGSYVARDAVKKRAKDAIGSYLARPAMHYTIGTRITPSVAKDLEEHNYSEVEASSSEPEFTPEMQRLRTASHANQDWLASLTTSYLTQQINESATRGDDTNVKENTDYRPRVMYGEGFGKRVHETGTF